MFAYVLVAATLAAPAFATVAITAPVASTAWTAGQQQTINWMDNGQTPNLQSFGPSEVGLFVGSQIQQTELQVIVASVDVSTTSSIAFTPDATIGPNGDYYFIRFTSIGLKDPSNPMYPAQAFSAKFTLSGMSGTFNSTVQAQVDAASSAPAPGATSAAASGAAGSSAAPASTSAPAGSSAAAGGSSAASKPASTSSHSSAAPSGSAAAKTTNGASGVAASFGFVGTVVALASAMLF